MKVLIISLDKKLFEAESEVRQRHIEYGRLFDELHILILGAGKEEKIAQNVWIYPSGKGIFKVCSAFKGTKKIVQKNKINLISSQDPFFAGFVGWLAKRKFKIPLQLQIHTDFLSPYFWRESFSNKLRVLLAKFLLPKADGVRAVSERIKNSLEEKNFKLRTEPIVLPIFVDAEKIRGASIKTDLHQKCPQFSFIILMASRLSKEKNIGLAVEAMQELLKKHPKAGLIITGEGPEKEKIKAKIQNLKVTDNVILEAWTDDLISYYKTADLFLLTSNYEGYGRAIVEAMAASCPVVMTDVGIAGEVLINRQNGIVIPANDKENLIRGLDLLLSNKEGRENLIKESQKTLGGLANKEQYLNLYRKLFL